MIDATTLRRLTIIAGLAALLAAPALAFDYDRYKTADLDDILALPRPGSGLDLNGAKPFLHFESRPVAAGTIRTDTAWQDRYGKDPSMDWSRYDPVNPQTFDADAFGGRSRKP